MKNGMIECSVCHSRLVSPSAKTVSRAYDRHRSKISSKHRALNVFLVVGDCILVGFQFTRLFLQTMVFKAHGKVKWLGRMLGCVVEAHNLGFDYLVLVVASMVSTSRFVSPWKIRWARPWKPILVFMSKVDGKFEFSPISVNFLTEIAKVLFAIVMLLLQARRQKLERSPFSQFPHLCRFLSDATTFMI
ncbi:CMP-sialic acid transporter 4 [Vitis vinifera]|uniref:CMP-sialic acid transporter 4 n=1 Tax=Vitis vinifera TaxID=29760 RepID=A0A438BND0_VITVI|nr:CMP-sialic acid transporter 4 [Vitis vinifera]